VEIGEEEKTWTVEPVEAPAEVPVEAPVEEPDLVPA